MQIALRFLHERGKLAALIPAHGHLVVEPLAPFAVHKVALRLDGVARGEQVCLALPAVVRDGARVEGAQVLFRNGDDVHVRRREVIFVIEDDGGADVFGQAVVVRVGAVRRGGVHVVAVALHRARPHVVELDLRALGDVVVERGKIALRGVAFDGFVGDVQNVDGGTRSAQRRVDAVAVAVARLHFVVDVDVARILFVELLHKALEHALFVVVAVAPERDGRFGACGEFILRGAGGETGRSREDEHGRHCRRHDFDASLLHGIFPPE